MRKIFNGNIIFLCLLFTQNCWKV